MLEFTQYQEVGQIKLSREFEGKPIYWVAAYLVDGLLIDTGCDHTAPELRDFLRDKNVTQAVNTHYHEDHIGGNWVISELFNLDIMAHPDTIPLMRQVPQLFPYQEVAWGYPQPSLAVPAGDIITTPSCRFE